MSAIDVEREMEKAMGPREKPCVQGGPHRCEYPHARNQKVIEERMDDIVWRLHVEATCPGVDADDLMRQAADTIDRQREEIGRLSNAMQGIALLNRSRDQLRDMARTALSPLPSETNDLERLARAALEDGT